MQMFSSTARKFHGTMVTRILIYYFALTSIVHAFSAGAKLRHMRPRPLPTWTPGGDSGEEVEGNNTVIDEGEGEEEGSGSHPMVINDRPATAEEKLLR